MPDTVLCIMLISVDKKKRSEKPPPGNKTK